MKKSALWIVVAAVIATGSYFAPTARRTQLGEAALKATALRFVLREPVLVLSKGARHAGAVDFPAIWCLTRCVLRAEVFTNTIVKQAITTGLCCLASTTKRQVLGIHAALRRAGLPEPAGAGCGRTVGAPRAHQL